MSFSIQQKPVVEPEPFYVAKRVIPWSALNMRSEVGMGFLPVYNSLLALRREFPDADYFTVKRTDDGQTKTKR